MIDSYGRITDETEFCTTGFKKHIFDIISFAKEHSFDGIELWYGHAKQYIEEIYARQA